MDKSTKELETFTANLSKDGKANLGMACIPDDLEPGSYTSGQIASKLAKQATQYDGLTAKIARFELVKGE
jgi:hypothetical protein